MLLSMSAFAQLSQTPKPPFDPSQPYEVIKDVTLPIRQEAAKMQSMLIKFGLSEEEADHIVFTKMPGDGTQEWWINECGVRFSKDQTKEISVVLFRYADVLSGAADAEKRNDMAERIILNVLKQERGISSVECYNLWQKGIINLPNEWWNTQVASLIPEKQNQMRAMYGQLLKYAAK